MNLILIKMEVQTIITRDKKKDKKIYIKSPIKFNDSNDKIMKKKDKAIPIKKNNNQKALYLDDKENNTFNKQNIFNSDIKNNNFNKEDINVNNNINIINSIKTEPDNKFKNLNQLLPPNLSNNMKLNDMARIDISSDYEEEQKKANEDPFLIPKKKHEQFIMEDDSFDFLVDSMKLSDENKEKKEINNINGDLFDDIKNSNFKNIMEKKKGKERDYGRGRNNNINNYEKNYLPFRNYYNYFGNGNGQNNSNNNDHSSSIKFPNDFDVYKKKYYK